MGEPPKKPYPPGWNDPPMLNYSPDNPPPKSRIGKKRVAFPLSGASRNSGEAPIPPQIPLPPNGAPCVDDLYLAASANFQHAVQVLDDQTLKEDISKMLSDWQSGKFSEAAQKLLSELAVKLSEGNNKAVLDEVYFRVAQLEDSSLKCYLTALKQLLAVKK